MDPHMPDEYALIIGPDGKALFTAGELRCKGTGMLRLAPGFADQLRELRLTFGRGMIVNSGCRSAEHNRSEGGHRRSLHVCDRPHWPTGGCAAVDIRSQGDEYDAELRELAWDMGWSIGINAAFTHLDRRTDYIPDIYPQHEQRRFSY